MATRTDNGMENKSTGRKALWFAVLSIIVWLSIGGFSGQAFSKISTVQKNDNASFLPGSAESTLANKVIAKFSPQSSDSLPTLLLFIGDINPAKNPQALADINTFVASLGSKVLPESGKPLSTYLIPGAPIVAVPSQDGKAAIVNLQFNATIATQNIEDKPALPKIIKFIRTEISK